VLHSHPKVEEAAVIRVADLGWGQQPRAIVVLKKGELTTAEEIIEYCRSKLASFKRPRSVVLVDSLPRNPMGKVLRKALGEQYGKPQLLKSGDFGVKVSEEVRIEVANQIGKRYVCRKCGSEFIVTRGGGGTLSCCGQPMELKK